LVRGVVGEGDRFITCGVSNFYRKITHINYHAWSQILILILILCTCPVRKK